MTRRPMARYHGAQRRRNNAMKTTPTTASVDAFLDAVEDPGKRDDARAVAAMMADITGAPARMWGAAIVGFGNYHYRYQSGREGDFFETGFSPRKRALTLYIMAGFSTYQNLLARLGPHTTGKSCLYLKRLADVDDAVLRELIEGSVQYIRAKYPSPP